MARDIPRRDGSFSSWAGNSIPEGSAKLELLAHIVEDSPTPIFVKDPSGTLLYVNAAYVDLDVRPVDQIIGARDVDLYPDADPDELRRDDELAMEDPGPFERVQHMRLKGLDRTFRTVKFPIYGRERKVLAICGMSIDITDTLQSEKDQQTERDREVAAKPFERLVASLTPAEARVTELLLLGFSDREIAADLHLTEDTVRHHVSHMLKKLRKRSRTQAVIALMLNRRRGG